MGAQNDWDCAMAEGAEDLVEPPPSSTAMRRLSFVWIYFHKQDKYLMKHSSIETNSFAQIIKFYAYWILKHDSILEQDQICGRSNAYIRRPTEMSSVEERQIMAAGKALFLGLTSPLEVIGVSIL